MIISLFFYFLRYISEEYVYQKKSRLNLKEKRRKKNKRSREYPFAILSFREIQAFVP